MRSTEIKPRELALLVRDVILKNPKRLDQGIYTSLTGRTVVATVRKYATKPMPAGTPSNEYWLDERPVCQTTACVAGWAAVLSAPVTWKIDDTDLITPGFDHHDIETYAQERLGITDDQAFWLFQGVRSRAEVLWALKYLAEHPDPDQPDKPDQAIDLYGACAAARVAR